MKIRATLPPTARVLVLLLAAATNLAAAPDPVSTYRPPEIPGMGLNLHLEKTSYRQGEPIRARLRFTYLGAESLKVGTCVASMSGRIDRVWFVGRNEAGASVDDPFRGESINSTRPPLTTLTDLTPTHPCDLEVTLNDWLALAKPGQYSVTAETAIVDLAENWDFARSFRPHVRVSSNPVELVITPCPGEQRMADLKTAEQNLASAAAATRGEALRTLRYLLDPAAMPLLITALEDPDFHNRRAAYAGLAAFPSLREVRTALLARLDRDGPRLLPAAKSGYAQLLTAAESQERNPKYHAITGVTEKWSNYVGEKMAAGLDRLSPAEAARRLYRMDTFGGSWASVSTAQKRLVLQFANSLSDAQWFFAGTPRNLEEINSYWMACFIDYRCREPELAPDLRELAANETVSPQVRMAAYKVLGESGIDPLPRITNFDAAQRSDVWITFPDAPVVERTENSWTIQFCGFTGGPVSVGKNVIPGVECEQTLTRPGQPAPERTLRYSVGLEMGQHREFWQYKVPRQPGETVTVKYRLTIFETDLPPQRDWAPRKGGYFKVLWEREFTPTLD